jgi:DEAD/DEAH box helicase domain-containing protein
VKSPHFGRPTLFLYDKVQGGVGLGELLFNAHRDLLAAALDVVTRCSCPAGCPACVGPTAEVGPLGKETVERLLIHLAGGAVPVEADVNDLEAPDEEEPADFGPLPRGAATEGL